MIDHPKWFWKKVDNRSTGCWEWQGNIGNKGYGRFGSYYSHRIAWALVNDEDPGDMNVNHDCDNPSCVNPDHLYKGTQQDNVEDMYNRNRRSETVSSGEIYKMVQLRKKGYTYKEIGSFIGYSKTTVWRKLKHNSSV